MSEVNISTKLVSILEILQGSRISDARAKDVIEGKLDIIVGIVAAQNYGVGKGYLNTATQTPNATPKTLTQITIKTDTGNHTLTDNIDFKLNANVLALENSDILNRPEIIHVENIIDFKEIFNDAARFGQRVAIIYDVEISHIITVSVESNHSFLAGNNISATTVCPTWGCPR